MYANRLGPRAEYREQQARRVIASPSLAEKFHKLKSLTVSVVHYDPTGLTQYRQLTYDVNLGHAKSVFRLDCTNEECVHGDYDLTHELASAAAHRVTTAKGELRCDGWQSKAQIKKTKCRHVLRYQLKLGY